MTVPLNTSLVVRCVRCECGGDSDASVVSVEVSAAGDVGALRAAVATELQRAACCSVEPASGGERVQLFVRCGASEAEELAPLNSDELPLQEIAFPSLASGAVEVYYSVEEEHCFGYTSCYYNGYYYSNCCYQSGSYVPCWATTTSKPSKINKNVYYAIIAVAGVIIIGCIIFVLVRRYRNKKNSQAAAPPPNEEVPQIDAPNSPMYYSNNQNPYTSSGGNPGTSPGVGYGAPPPVAGGYDNGNYGGGAPPNSYTNNNMNYGYPQGNYGQQGYNGYNQPGGYGLYSGQQPTAL